MKVQVGIPGGVPSQSAQSHKAQHEHAHRPKAETGTKKPVNVFFGGELAAVYTAREDRW